MAETAATRRGSTLTVRKREDERTFRALAADDFSRVKGHAPWPSQIDRLEAMGRHLRWLLDHEGDAVIRSFPQIFRALGLPVTGNVKRDRARHRSTTARRLDDMVEMGWLDGWQPVLKANGEGRGILLRVRRDSSVGGAHPSSFRRPPRPPRRPGPPSPPVSGEGPRRRPSSCRELVPPLREKSPRSGYKLCLVVEEQQSRDARARRLLRGHAQITGYVARHLAGVTEETGSAVLERSPWLADVPVSVLLRAATKAFASKPGSGWAKHWSSRLSASSQRQAEHAVELLDRYDGRGAGAAAIIDLAAGGGRIHTPAGRSPRFPEPRTPGLLVRGLRKRARAARDVARYRPDYAAALAGSTP
jgi:hypothetical protein